MGWFDRLFFEQIPQGSDRATYFRELGSCYLNRHHYRDAAKHLEKAVEFGVDDLECQLKLSLAYSRSGRLEEALALLSDLKFTHPRDAGVATLLGKALLLDGQYHKAIKVMRPAAVIHQDRFNLHFYLGLAFAKSQDFDSAVDVWSQAARIRPGDTQTKKMIARAQAVLSS